MKWIGQHIFDFIARFRSDVYMEDIPDGTIADGKNLGLDGSNKVVKQAVSSGVVATTIEVADESTDVTCFPLFTTAATGDLEPKSGSNLTFNSSSGLLTASGFVGDLDGTAAFADDALGANVAAHVTITDNENTAENNLITFIEGGAGAGTRGLESDGDFHYNPSTGTVTAAVLAGSSGLTLDNVDITTIQTGSESFADNDTSLMTSAAINDLASNTEFSNSLESIGAFQGDVVYFGNTTSMTIGTIYMYTGLTNSWVAADATAVADCDGLLAVALGASSDTNGMLLRGMVVLDHSAGSVAAVLFLSTTPGDATSTAPSSNNNVVRVVGYKITGANGTPGKVWFSPDNTFVEVTA